MVIDAGRVHTISVTLVEEFGLNSCSQQKLAGSRSRMHVESLRRDQITYVLLAHFNWAFCGRVQYLVTLLAKSMSWRTFLLGELCEDQRCPYWGTRFVWAAVITLSGTGFRHGRMARN